ncbi:hypothetical protein [Streptomyces sp. NBC_00670]|uniref:hypothetical protein n=1 Tax=Streptomyces sp. NBC_00670 TaxID=2975804 RepID=UPI002E37A271|nr:hypothetical protein [Streptomyces sp. NBC_00670]
MAERLRGAWPPADVLHEVCADVVAWTNDLRDAGPRPAAGEATLVDVLARERTLGRGEAAALVREMTAERLDDFERAAGRLTARHAHAEDVRARIDRVRTFLYGAVAWQHESGRYRAGLVLETALLPALLRVRGRHPEEQRELTAWLDGRREGADPLDGLLIDCCLRPHTLLADAATAARTVTGGPGTGTAGLKTAGLGTVGVETAGSEAEGTGVGGRGRLKRSMPHAVLHLLGGLRLTGEDTPAPMPAQGLPTYTTVHLLAVGSCTPRPPATRTRSPPASASTWPTCALGGAVADRPAHATAFPHRSAVGVVQYHSYWHQFTDRAHVDRRRNRLREVHAIPQAVTPGPTSRPVPSNSAAV